MEVFLRAPSKEFMQSELRKQTGLAKATLIKWLSFLLKHGIIEVQTKGNVNIYRLAVKNSVVRQLKILLSVVELQNVKEIAGKYDCGVYLYGSGARGEDNEQSDIDLLVMGKSVSHTILKELEKSIKTTKRISVKVFTPTEWSQMSRKDQAFYQRVEKDKILLT